MKTWGGRLVLAVATGVGIGLVELVREPVAELVRRAVNPPTAAAPAAPRKSQAPRPVAAAESPCRGKNGR